MFSLVSFSFYSLSIFFSLFLFLTLSKWKLLVLNINWAQAIDNMLMVSHTMAAIWYNQAGVRI
jgi:hypothetical protein